MKSFNIAQVTITKDFVNIVNKYDFDVDLSSSRYIVDAKSIMVFSVLTLVNQLNLKLIQMIVKIL